MGEEWGNWDWVDVVCQLIELAVVPRKHWNLRRKLDTWDWWGVLTNIVNLIISKDSPLIQPQQLCNTLGRDGCSLTTCLIPVYSKGTFTDNTCDYTFSISSFCSLEAQHTFFTFHLTRWVWWSLSSLWLLHQLLNWWLSWRCTIHEHHCDSSLQGSLWLSFQYLQKRSKPTQYIAPLHQLTLFFRVLVLYLGNLYSLIIALLDKVNSMSSVVSIRTIEC